MILDIDPKVDYAFKRVFGRTETSLLLIDIIDSVLNPAPEHRITSIVLQNPFNEKEALDDKLSILDIKARDQSDRQFNVEMQMLAIGYYEKRIVYYWAKLHQQQLHEGQNYEQLKPTISISFLDHVLFPQTTEYHLRFRLLEETQHFPCTEDIDFHILELPKFRKAAHELSSNLDTWLYFLRHAAMMDMEALPAAFQQPLFRRALEELHVLTQDQAERERYEARRKAQLDINSSVLVAHLQGEKIGRAEGEKIGRAEGEKIGRAEGEKIGRAEGEKFGALIGVIQFCERCLGQPVIPADQLADLPPEDLTRLAGELQAQVQQRR